MRRALAELVAFESYLDVSVRRFLGGTGSGNFGHAGRPGEVGGSAPSEGESAKGSTLSSGTPQSATLLGGGHVNTVALVEFEDGKKGVFKPESGEYRKGGFANGDINRALNNMDLSLAEREVMAYQVDQLLGTDLVPETVYRENVQIDVPEKESEHVAMDSADLRSKYESYREGAIDRAYEAAGEEMAQMHGEAQQEHLEDLQKRNEEIASIWNKLIDEHPEWQDVGPYGHRSALIEHPVLPMGTEGGIPVQGFERAKVGGVVDPIDLMDRAGIDPSSKLSDGEKHKVRELLEEELRGGAQYLGDVDLSRGREHLTYGQFVEGHQETEGRLIEKNIQSFDAWKKSQGYTSQGAAEKLSGSTNGSMQRYVEHLTDWGDLNYEKTDYQRFAAFDYLVGSMDRHGSNVFFDDSTGKPLALDNGYSFPNSNDVSFRSSPTNDFLRYAKNDDKLRLSQYEGQDAWRKATHDRLEKADWNAFLAKHPRMSAEEKESFLERVGDLTNALQTTDGLYQLWRGHPLMR